MRENHRKNNYRSWVEIDTAALRHNFGEFRKVIPRQTRVMAIVKSNAYGHGMVECARIFEKVGAHFLGVDDIDEALALRKAGIKKPILVLGYTLPPRYIEAAKKNISITISSLSQLKNLIKISAKGGPALGWHLKVDTGLHRQGVQPSEVSEAIRLLSKVNGQMSNVALEGLYSHFAGVESKKFESYSKRQIAIFEKTREQFREAGFDPICHMDGTAASLLLPDSHFDMVRLGIGLYGLWPSLETKKQVQHSNILKNVGMLLRPALSWKSVISEVKRVKKGERVGYDLTEKLKRDSVLAIVPVGYWHGYPRSLSGVGRVMVKGLRQTDRRVRQSEWRKKSKVIGRVSMDMMVIDVTNVKGVKEGDEIVLIGKGVPAEDVAEKAGTINYEIVTRINPLLERTFS